MRSVIFVVILAIALAGGSYRNNRVLLQPGSKNVLKFACGKYDQEGSTSVWNQAYTYTATNLPSWCTFQGNTLTGIPPVGAVGPWPINVQYQGPRGAGLSSFLLTVDNNVNWSTAGLSWINCLQGTLQGWNYVPAADAGNWVVLLPVVTDNFPTTVTCADQANAHNAAQEKVNDIQISLNDLNKKLSDAQELVKSLNSQIAARQNDLNNANSDEKDTYNKWDTCRTTANTKINVQNNLVGGTTVTTGSFGSVISTGSTTIATGLGGSIISTPGISITTGGISTDACGGIQASGHGTGIVVSVGQNFLVLNNGVRLNFGGCTSRNYRKGRQAFSIADTVTYDLYNQSGNVFAKTVTCQ